ncbi:tRNA (adenosine(37)-N6)-dimethylallyltransferase MiaA [Candidatus Peregrinibacteria bacterium RIFOXYB2_FULL_32_7]|nr:MAG: tRNA (adenosine(37)-N6)-dimethylallyltransferase MiaA [Candidatus Peregrinibacteria bacterium RIFOXYB2_FULL_32_7]
MNPEDLISSFLKNIPKEKIPLIVLLGPTASGKTGLSIKLAKKFNGEIISADSRQIYKEMDIGTAKITKKEMQDIPHHLIDVVLPNENFTTFDFKKLAEEKIFDIYKRNKIPFIIGGTGLYIRAIIENFTLGATPPNWELRKQLEEEASQYGKEYVWEKLKALDEIEAMKIHPNNLRYVIRGIERVGSLQMAVGSENKNSCSHKNDKYHILKFAIDWPREVLYDRINKRVDKQIENGLIEETKYLLSKYDRNLPSMSSLGYLQIAKFLNNEMTLDEAKDLLKKETRHYAKRQMTWFLKEKEVVWINS